MSSSLMDIEQAGMVVCQYVDIYMVLNQKKKKHL